MTTMASSTSANQTHRGASHAGGGASYCREEHAALSYPSDQQGHQNVAAPIPCAAACPSSRSPIITESTVRTIDAFRPVSPMRTTVEALGEQPGVVRA